MATNYLNYANYRYSFAGKAAWERKFNRLADKLFSESIIEGQLTNSGLQDFIWIMSYADHKGSLNVAEIEVSDEQIEEITEAVFKELNRWVAHKSEVLKKKTEATKQSAETNTAE